MLELIAIIIVGITLVGGGVATLRKGRIRATKNSVVEGAPAITIGVLLLLTIPLAFACYFLFRGALKDLDPGGPLEFLAFCLSLLLCPSIAIFIGVISPKRIQPAAKKELAKEPTDFQVSCACGGQITVTEAQAGATVLCRCGRSLRVPSLSELRSARTP
jgi:hypothetical protein